MSEKIELHCEEFVGEYCARYEGAWLRWYLSVRKRFHTKVLFADCVRLRRIRARPTRPTVYRVDIQLNDPNVHIWMS